MKSLFRLSALIAAMAAMTAFTSSCESLETMMDDMEKPDTEKDKTQYVVTIHEVVKYPRAQALEMNIPTFSGSTVCINANYFIHSRNITRIDIFEEKDKPGFYDLDLILDRRGRLLWTSISVNFRGAQMGFVIDGLYYRGFVPEQLDSDEDMIVRVKGPFDTATAMGLKKHAEKNYKIYNDKDK